MGNTLQRPSPEEEKKRKRLESYGVLIPPSFGVGCESSLPPSVTIRDIIHPEDDSTTLLSPLFFRSENLASVADRILYQHMTPGLWIQAMTPKGSVWAASGPIFPSASFSSSSAYHQAGGPSVLAAVHSITPTTQLRLGTSSSTSSSTTGFDGNKNATHATLTCNLDPIQLHAQLVSSNNNNNMPSAWVGGSWEATKVLELISSGDAKDNNNDGVAYYRNAPTTTTSTTTREKPPQRLWLGSRLFFPSFQSSLYSTKGAISSMVPKATTMELDGVLQAEGAEISVQTKLPLDTLEPQTSYHVSCNLSFDDNDDNDDELLSSPPLWVHLDKTPCSTRMSLSQTLTLDRSVMNPLEERCPKIRNTLGWTVQLLHEHNGDDDSNPQSKRPLFQASVVHQINRNVAWKVVMGSSSSSASTTNSSSGAPNITGALLLKRWKQPRVMCSVLWDLSSNSFQGIGIEVETGYNDKSSSSSKNYNNGNSPDRIPRRVDSNTPETRATLPEEDDNDRFAMPK